MFLELLKQLAGKSLFRGLLFQETCTSATMAQQRREEGASARKRLYYHVPPGKPPGL
jgi:hypothetical protein